MRGRAAFATVAGHARTKEERMEPAGTRRVLVVANHSVATPELLEEIRRRSQARACDFTLLIPDAPPGAVGEWTLEHAVPLMSQAAGRPVAGLLCRKGDPFHAIQDALAGGDFDEVVISTLPRARSRWLRRSLPRRVERLGVAVSVVTPDAAREPAPA
jgi:hypothetical protein